ncbi:TetR/AcrR family transcriptional regulator [Streptacidiphilus jiangxiensis]|uniref:DNA-binding transcriptional regulator, AcrR family n=1 Tax=Streptacidiphilus jiangxiensis TaxID=235985 RepID=A0A1H7WIJ9_STRJI|nr:TetR/AcrR family transcriptional regulator [Streptacidiphilus jiangxiensis]SEM20945.1 DNA-binding transcriptional regulator, AcrR family [Streptacidiphilus jiangxiensis]
MSPRGVAITGVRELLFDAAERVLAREGPAGLTSRAITEEAGRAKGLLHLHFADLDDFVAQLVLHRFAAIAARVADLPAAAGTRTPAANLGDAGRALLGAPGPAIAAAAMTRTGAAQRVADAWAHGAPGLGTIQSSIADYLRAEQGLGRITADRDCEALALAFVGTAHHLLLTTGPGGPDPYGQLERVVSTLI